MNSNKSCNISLGEKLPYKINLIIQKMKTLFRLTIIALLFLMVPKSASAQQNKERKKVTNISISDYWGGVEIQEGFWTATKEKDIIYIQLMNSRKTQGSFFINFSVNENELKKNGSSSFLLNRAVGQINFKGQFPTNESMGKFSFQQNDDFKRFLKGKVLTNVSEKEEYYLFKLFLGNVTKNYVNSLGQRDYKPTLKQLGKMAIHEVSIEYIDALEKTNYKGLDVDMLVRFAIHDITIDYLDELKKAGYGDIDAQMVKRFAIHGVNMNYINDLSSVGYGNLDANMLKKFAAHKIGATYIKSLLTTNIRKPDANDIKKAKIHKISASYINDAQRNGHDAKELSYYVKLKVKGRHNFKSKLKS